MLFGLASQITPSITGPQLVKFPDAKPLKLVGCLSPWAKSISSGNLLLAGILAFYAVKTCSKHAIASY